MSNARIALSYCVLLVLSSTATAMPAAPDAASAFVATANLLPCQQHIATLAADLGYTETAQTKFDADYVDIVYSDIQGHSLLTVAVENTPIGAQFSVTLDIPETDPEYAEDIATALRTSLSLPAPTQLQNLATGAAQSWNTALTGGDAQIIVNHTDMSTQLVALMSPLTRGAQLPC